MCTYTLQVITDARLRLRPQPKLPRRDHPAAPLFPVYVGHNLPDTISLRVLLRHFEEHNFWPDMERSTVVDTFGKRHGKLFFSDSDAADCAIAAVNGTKIGSFAIVVEHWESRVKQPLPSNSVRAKIVEQSAPRNVLPAEPSKLQKSIDVPHEWEGDLKAFSLKVVPSDSAEFNKVLLLMQKTMPSVRITKLERIQNEWLWNRYSQHCDEIKEKNGGVLMEKELFHGTGVNDPQHIYKGEEGFDMRFCVNGMWGRGSYFAANAKYSDRYAFTSRGGGIAGSRQMFLARVNIGETHECPPDRNLTMPPMKPSQASTSSSVQFSVVRYDSVTGITSGSQVYIVYDNRKAYPLYLITYTLALPSFLF